MGALVPAPQKIRLVILETSCPGGNLEEFPFWAMKIPEHRLEMVLCSRTLIPTLCPSQDLRNYFTLIRNIRVSNPINESYVKQFK